MSHLIIHEYALGVNQYIDISIRIDIYLSDDTRYRSKPIFQYEVRSEVGVLNYLVVIGVPQLL
jgi:hypothetical protein